MLIKELPDTERKRLNEAFKKLWKNATESFDTMYNERSIDYVKGLFMGKFVKGCNKSKLFGRELERIKND